MLLNPSHGAAYHSFGLTNQRDLISDDAYELHLEFAISGTTVELEAFARVIIQAVRARFADIREGMKVGSSQEGRRGGWAEFNGTSATDDNARALYGRLVGGLQSDHERNLLYAYCKNHPIIEGNWPALLPQFYLRWDPFSGRAVKLPQRYDFLLLLSNGGFRLLESRACHRAQP